MKSKRLTNDMRDEIARSLRAKLEEKARLMELKQAVYNIGILLRNDVLGEHKKAFDSIPARLLPADEDFRITVDKMTWEIEMGRYVPMWDHTFSSIKDYESNHPLIQRYLAASDAYNAANNAVNVAVKEAKKVLKGVKTTKRLLEVWPEGEDYLPAEEEPMQLPAVRSDTLNCLINNIMEDGNKDCGARRGALAMSEMVLVPQDLLFDLIANTQTLAFEYRTQFPTAPEFVETLENEVKRAKAYYSGLDSKQTRTFAPEVRNEKGNA